MTSKVLEGNFTGLNAEDLREAREIFLRVFPGSRVSPLYPRTKGRPGWIVFYTMYQANLYPPDRKFTQLELPSEGI